MILLIVSTQRSQLHKAGKYSSDCQRPGEGKNAELVFNGDRASVWEDEKVRKVDGSDGCMTV